MSEEHPNTTARQMTAADIPAVVQLEERVFPEMLAWTSEELMQHLAVFPEGQLVAVDESGKLIGSASSLIIDWDDYAESAKWSSITGTVAFARTTPWAKRYTAQTCASIHRLAAAEWARSSMKRAKSWSRIAG